LMVFILGMTPGAEGLGDERAWVRGFYDALAPHSLGQGTYVNEIMPDDVHRVPASYGAKYARLTRIKAAYDPDNLFHRNANIPPMS
jgi:FAD/FMN-containing dehydrogenase